jgi:hypothetical protein
MLRGLFVSAMLVMQAVPAWAIDGFAVEVGQDRKTDMARIAAQWQWSKRLLQGQAWHVGGYWDLSVAQWERDQATPGDRKQVTEIGLTPVFRLQGNDLRGLYLEGGIGAHLLSATQLGDKRFSTAFQANTSDSAIASVHAVQWTSATATSICPMRISKSPTTASMRTNCVFSTGFSSAFPAFARRQLPLRLK